MDNRGDFTKEADRDYAIGCLVFIIVLAICMGVFIYMMIYP